MKKIDIHCHVTNRPLIDMAVEKADMRAVWDNMFEHDVDTVVLLATYFPHKGTGISNYRLVDWIRQFNLSEFAHKQLEEGVQKRFRMFGSLDFEHYYYQGLNEITELAENILSGIKIYTGYQDIDLHSDKFTQVMRLAKEYNLPMMFHTGYSYRTRRQYGKVAFADVVKVSDLEFVADQGIIVIASHMGKPHFDDTIATLQRNPNMYTDMSGLIDSKSDRDEIPESIEAVRRVVSECGPHKLLFGTDFPVQTHEDSINFVEEGMKGFSEADKQRVYYDNAVEVVNVK